MNTGEKLIELWTRESLDGWERESPIPEEEVALYLLAAEATKQDARRHHEESGVFRSPAFEGVVKDLSGLSAEALMAEFRDRFGETNDRGAKAVLGRLELGPLRWYRRVMKLAPLRFRPNGQRSVVKEWASCERRGFAPHLSAPEREILVAYRDASGVNWIAAGYHRADSLFRRGEREVRTYFAVPIEP